MADHSDTGGTRSAPPPGGPRAETYLRMLADRELHWVVAQPDLSPVPASGHPPLAPAAQAVNRVRAAAGALVASGVVGEAAAISVLAGLIEALTARSKLPPVHPYKSLVAAGLWRPPPEPARPAGPVRLVPVGKHVLFPDNGDQTRMLHLLTLALAPDLAALSYAGRVPVPDHIPAPRGLPAAPVGPFGPTTASGHLTFTDDRGSSYQARLSGGGTTDGTWWSGEFWLSPVPPGDARWLDITPVSSAGAVRVDLTGPAVLAGPHAGPASPASAGDRAGGLPQAGASPAERLLDSLAHDLLWSVLWTGGGGRAQSDLADMIPALAATGAIEPGVPALARLAGLTQRLGIDLPAGLPSAPAMDLPEAWNSVLASRGRHDGREGLAPAAALLPEADGAVFAVTGLYSTEQAVILRALAWGWHAERTRFPRTGRRYHWWALDNTGRWHIAQQANAAIGGMNGHGDSDLAFVPPLHPAATSLEIILTGPAARASATTPLNWQPLS